MIAAEVSCERGKLGRSSWPTIFVDADLAGEIRQGWPTRTVDQETKKDRAEPQNLSAADENGDDSPKGQHQKRGEDNDAVAGHSFFVAKRSQALNTSGGEVMDQLGV